MSMPAAICSVFQRKCDARLDRCRRLPTGGQTVATEDAVVIISAVMDGLWLDYCLSPTRTTRDRALDLCCLTARRLIPPR